MQIRKTIKRETGARLLCLFGAAFILVVVVSGLLTGRYGLGKMSGTAVGLLVVLAGMSLSADKAARQTILFRAGVMTVLTLVFLALGAVLIEIFVRPDLFIIGWRSWEPEEELNQLGFRGQTIACSEDDLVIVLLGDSQAAALGRSFEQMPERQLERHLAGLLDRPVKVFTMGAEGYGQDQLLLALEEYYTLYRADLVINWLTPYNDVWNNLFPTHLPESGYPKPTFWLEDGELYGPTFQLGEQAYGDAPNKLATLIRMVTSGTRIPTDRVWEERLPPAYQPFSAADGEVFTLWQDWWDADAIHIREERFETEKTHTAIYFTPRSPRMQYGIDLTRALLREIDVLVADHGGRFVIFTSAAPHRLVPEPGYYELNGLYYHATRTQYEANLSDIVEGFTYYAIPVVADDPFISATDSHLNDDAADQVMRDLAAQLVDLLNE
nr:hypothetical protein [Anaerolineae bacterium]